MIVIRATVQSGHVHLDVSGHAGHAAYGEDIVCAAVSAIVQTALLGLEAVASEHPEHVTIEYAA